VKPFDVCMQDDFQHSHEEQDPEPVPRKRTVCTKMYAVGIQEFHILIFYVEIHIPNFPA